MDPGTATAANASKHKRCKQGHALCDGHCCQPGQRCVHPKRKPGSKHAPKPKCECVAPRRQCAGAGCIDVRSDPRNCGACGNACGLGQVCASGVCTTTCSAGQVACAGACVALASDPHNCGSCGHGCPDGQACVGGTCTLVCGAGQVVCGGACTTLASDPANCGACGHACASSQVCANGTCETTCPTGMTVCGAACVNVQTDAAHCGGCDQLCAPQNASGACVAGQCQVGTCNPDYADCNGLPGDGCEVHLPSDAGHCGTCGNACSGDHATMICANGGCAVGTCAAGFDDCDHDPSTGCEQDIYGDPANCGACGGVCSGLDHVSTYSCTAGTCGIGTCDQPLEHCSTPWWNDCDGDPATGCETDLTLTDNCGGCGLRCNLAHATNGCHRANACDQPNCYVVSCNPGYCYVPGGPGPRDSIAGNPNSGLGCFYAWNSSVHCPRNFCVQPSQCSSSMDGHACIANHCGCTGSADCPGTTTCDASGLCLCTDNSQCPSGRCDPTFNFCV
jgi:hypothetical protein